MGKKIWIILLLILIVAYTVSISGKKGSTENAVMTVEKSEKFKNTEIETAIDRVKKEFKGFTNCEMTKIYYDEEKSNMEINYYLTENQENKSVKNADKKIFIVLYSDFEVREENNQNSGFMPGSHHKNWMWLLKKDEFWKSWKVVTFGV
ncbi:MULTISPECIES: hypothetical protein [Enterococcus]|uniref:hypothetical protein n=1 Tax=Enterococcus TaxID=1350 RepID=UPI000A3450B6|nr:MULTISPECIES: hypothetical protein [unclassified Enterococcus]